MDNVIDLICMVLGVFCLVVVKVGAVYVFASGVVSGCVWIGHFFCCVNPCTLLPLILIIDRVYKGWY